MLSNYYYRSKDDCKNRWKRVLDPNLKKINWTDYENTRLFALVREYGNKCNWSKIARIMGNRSDIQCRYHYFQLIRLVPKLMTPPKGFNGKIGDKYFDKITGREYLLGSNGYLHLLA